MNEDDLRDAFRATAAEVHASADALERLESRLRAPRSTSAARAFAFGGITIALLVALVAGALWFGREDHQVVAPMPHSMPSRIVAVTAHDNLVVLRTRTGAVIRTLARHLATRRGFELAASAGGRTILYTSMASGGASVSAAGACPGADPIVLKSTGRFVGDGNTVALSPDGRWMAIGRSADGACEGPTAVTVTDLRTGTERTLGTTRPQLTVSHLSWAQDSRHLAFSWANLQYVIDTQTATSLDDHVCVCPVEAPSKWLTVERFGYLGSSNEFLGIRAFRHFPDLTGQAVVWGTDGVLKRKLFSWPARIEQLASDRTGRHVLAVLPRTPRRRTSAFALYRWSEGQQKPTMIRDDIVAAAWIPDAPVRTAAPVIAAVRADGHVVLLDRATGATQRDVGTAFDASQLAGDPVGGDLLVGVNTSDECETEQAPHIDRINLADGATQRAGSGRFPAVSGRGLMAYEVRCDGVTLGTTDLGSGANTRSNPLADSPSESSPRVQVVRPEAWSPDGTRLLYLVVVRGRGPRWYVGRVRTQGFVGDVRRLPFGSDAALTFLDNRHLLVSTPHDGRSVARVATLPRQRDEPVTVGRTMIGVRGVITRLVVDPSRQWVLALEYGGTLVSWKRGKHRAEEVARDIDAATWLWGP